MDRFLQTLVEMGVLFVKNCPLWKHSSFRIGGDADVGVFPKTREELIAVLSLLHASKIPMLVIGKGSNVVFADEGFRGAVVFTEECKAICRDGDGLVADAGISLAALATFAAKESLTGAEFAHGIPGTLGGAVFMNAGAYDGCMAGICVKSQYYDLQAERIVTLCGEAQNFSVRSSFYTDHPEAVILGARLALSKGNEQEICEKMKELAARRKASQPLEYPSAGSVFKRPAGHFAGKLIEDCGLKGLTVGGAQVSEKHAGFIINQGGATAADVRRLVEQIKETVLEKTGVLLECEIRFL